MSGDERTPAVVCHRCRWTATDFQQKATGVLLQAITHLYLSAGFYDYKRRHLKTCAHSWPNIASFNFFFFFFFFFLFNILHTTLTRHMLIFRFVFTLCLPLPSFFMSPVSGKKNRKEKRVKDGWTSQKKKKVYKKHLPGASWFLGLSTNPCSISILHIFLHFLRQKKIEKKETDGWFTRKRKKRFQKTLTRHMLVFRFVKRSTLRQLLLLFSKFLFTKKKIEKQKEENERK